MGSVFGGVCVGVIYNVFRLRLAQILRDENSIVMKLHISTHHDISSAAPVSFVGQGLSLTCSVEHSQIYVYPLRFAPFFRD